MNTLSRHRSPLAFPLNKPHCRIALKNHHQKEKSKHLRKRMKRLRSEMEEISQEQEQIKKGQRQVREKFEALEMECELLRRETNIIMQKSMSTQLRLAFMFQILKARENQDLDHATRLTSALRELIARENRNEADG